MPVSSTVDKQGSSDTDGAALPINELFYSLQGEGKLAGTPSVFVRTSGCNLRCWFCDSYHTSWEPMHAAMSIDEIVEKVRSYNSANHIVLTGGEPFIHDQVVDLINRFDDLNYHITVETNGTIHRNASIDLVSISPKLASSAPTAERDPIGDGEWKDRHDDRRINLDALGALVDDYNTQLKFVVTGSEDMVEIESIVSDIRSVTSNQVCDSDVLLMPEGTNQKDLADRQTKVADLAMEYGYRYTSRLHVDLWDDAPET